MDMEFGFTIHKNQKIDSKIAEHMKIISAEIIETYGKVRSIILAGGFGKGEGSVKMLPGGQVMPLKDYDIFVISDVLVSEKEHLYMIERIHKKIGIGSAEHYSDTPGQFSVGIQVIPLQKLSRLPPDISNVDLKIASKVIYGEDYRNRIPVGPSDIVLSSGAIVLFNKVIGMLQEMNPTLLSDLSKKEGGESLIYVCGKTFVEICTALSIMAGLYKPYYLERAKRFAQFFPNRFPDLYEELPDLADIVTLFTNIKLESKFNEYKSDPVDLWFDTRCYLLQVIRYYMGKFLGIDPSIPNLKDFVDEMYRRMGYEFFKQYLHYNLRGLRGYHPILLPLLSYIGQVYDNLLFIWRIKLIKNTLSLTPLLYWRSPIIKIYSAALLTLCAINRSGVIDETLLRSAYSYIRQAFPYNKYAVSSLMKWNNLRIVCVEAQKLYSLNTKRTF